MKELKRSVFGSVVMGACVVKLIKRKNGSLEVKMSQGTSASTYNVTALNAEEVYIYVCSLALTKHGELKRAA